MVTLQTLLGMTVTEVLNPATAHLELVRHVLLHHPRAIPVDAGQIEVGTPTKRLGLSLIKEPPFGFYLGVCYPPQQNQN